MNCELRTTQYDNVTSVICNDRFCDINIIRNYAFIQILNTYFYQSLNL